LVGRKKAQKAQNDFFSQFLWLLAALNDLVIVIRGYLRPSPSASVTLLVCFVDFVVYTSASLLFCVEKGFKSARGDARPTARTSWRWVRARTTGSTEARLIRNRN
jgi:hypothetical protein